MNSSALNLQRQKSWRPALAEKVRNRLQSEAIWSAIGKTMTAAQDLDEVLTTIIQVINSKLHVETGSVLLREPGSAELTFAKILRGNEEMFATLRIRVGQGVVGWVAQTGQSLIVPDATKEPRWFNGVDRQTGFVTHSILCVPLKVKNETIGVIELLNKQGGGFTANDLNLLESVAAPVAVAIQNARLHRQIQNQLDQVSALFHQVAHAKKEWEQTVDAIDEGISLQDAHSRILRVNSSLADWVGTTPTDIIGQPCCQVIHQLVDAPAYCPHLTAQPGQTARAEFYEPRMKRAFLCTVYPSQDAQGKLTGTVNVLKDISKEKELAAQLIQSEKSAAIGQLSASLAHEINNPLQAIQGCLDLAQLQNPETAHSDKYLAIARSELARLKTIVERMVDFNRTSDVGMVSLYMPDLVDDVLALCAKRLEQANITVNKGWHSPVPRILGVENQLRQVFLNLVLNAMDSMPQGGTLSITSRMRQQHGVWLTIQVADTGGGIAPTEMTKIFEPYFTTKKNGTGLGLPICRTILDSHNGRLTVESKLGVGSIFTVWLAAE